jgi:uncharacterized protein (TIGR02246 family)
MRPRPESLLRGGASSSNTELLHQLLAALFHEGAFLELAMAAVRRSRRRSLRAVAPLAFRVTTARAIPGCSPVEDPGAAHPRSPDICDTHNSPGGRMRRLIVVLVLLPVIAGCAAAPQVDVTAEVEAIRARSAGLVAAEVAQDAALSTSFYAPDAISQPAGSPQLQGRDAIHELYGHFFSGMLKDFEGITTHIDVAASGDLAWEYGSNHMVLNGPDGDLLDVGKYLAVWKKMDGEWYIAALSFSSDAPPAGR